MHLKDPFPTLQPRVGSSRWRRGPRGFFIESLLILGASLMWVVVLPLAGLVFSASALARRLHSAG